MTRSEGTAAADFSQFELHLGDGGAVLDEVDLGLAYDFDHVVLTSARQHGQLPVRVDVVDQRPPVEPGWEAAVEFSARTGPGVRVTGWGGEGGFSVPVEAPADLRIRYVVEDGQAGSEQFDTQWDEPPREHYLLQLWPAPPEPPQLLVASSPWSQYWAFGPAATALLDELADTPDPERLVLVVDRALADHPDVAAALRAGDERYRLGILRYVGELFRVTHHAGAYAAERADRSLLDRLIDARARAAG
jgi:hypothetical protein